MNVKKRGPFGFDPLRIGFIQPTFYAPLKTKANVINASAKMYTDLFLICQNIMILYIAMSNS